MVDRPDRGKSTTDGADDDELARWAEYALHVTGGDAELRSIDRELERAAANEFAEAMAGSGRDGQRVAGPFRVRAGDGVVEFCYGAHMMRIEWDGTERELVELASRFATYLLEARDARPTHGFLAYGDDAVVALVANSVDSRNPRPAELRRRLASSVFVPLEEVDPAMASGVAERLTDEFIVLAGIDHRWLEAVRSALKLEVGDGLVRITLGTLGTMTHVLAGESDDPDALSQELDAAVSGVAEHFSDTYKEDRGRYGDAPWG